MFITRIIGSMFRNAIKLTIYAGLGLAGFGTWDYIKQAQEYGQGYTIAQHIPTVQTRYADQIGMAATAAGVAKSGLLAGADLAATGAAAGLKFAKDSGVLEKVGLEGLIAEEDVIVATEEAKPIEEVAPLVEAEPTAEVVPAPVVPIETDATEAFEIASVAEGLAPESSIVPRARAID